jgi:hypothetical protein
MKFLKFSIYLYPVLLSIGVYLRLNNENVITNEQNIKNTIVFTFLYFLQTFTSNYVIFSNKTISKYYIFYVLHVFYLINYTFSFNGRFVTGTLKQTISNISTLYSGKKKY